MHPSKPQELMTSSIQFIDAQRSRTHGFKPPVHYPHFIQQPAVAVSLAELSALVATVPLALAHMGEGQFLLVAVTGFADGRNLLVDDDGRWGGLYLPHEMRCWPFSVAPLGQKNDQQQTYGVRFDHASGLYREAPQEDQGDARFFTDDGQPQPVFQRITQALQRHTTQMRQTQQAVKAIQDARLLTPWQIAPREGHTEELLPQGLYRVDESRLNKLDGEALQTLHRANGLALVYAQLLSMSRVLVLQRLKDALIARQARAVSAAAPAAPPPDPGIVQRLFDPLHPPGDTLKFPAKF